jgi:hypothetical protein
VLPGVVEVQMTAARWQAGPPQLWGRPCAAEKGRRAGEPGRDRCALEWRGEF